MRRRRRQVSLTLAGSLFPPSSIETGLLYCMGPLPSLFFLPSKSPLSLGQLARCLSGKEEDGGSIIISCGLSLSLPPSTFFPPSLWKGGRAVPDYLLEEKEEKGHLPLLSANGRFSGGSSRYGTGRDPESIF